MLTTTVPVTAVKDSVEVGGANHPIALSFYVRTDAPVQLTLADGAQLTSCGLLSKVGRSTQFSYTRSGGWKVSPFAAPFSSTQFAAVLLAITFSNASIQPDPPSM